MTFEKRQKKLYTKPLKTSCKCQTYRVGWIKEVYDPERESFGSKDVVGECFRECLPIKDSDATDPDPKANIVCVCVGRPPGLHKKECKGRISTPIEDSDATASHCGG
eukprot:GHVP01018790.1.p1 GENE.GHVP01018790.1~~GHVP01018790.1.p1  ORF type:complete len:107 (+),score=10.53 GHVP01018790.1:112-432(+)